MSRKTPPPHSPPPPPNARGWKPTPTGLLPEHFPKNHRASVSTHATVALGEPVPVSPDACILSFPIDRDDPHGPRYELLMREGPVAALALVCRRSPTDDVVYAVGDPEALRTVESIPYVQLLMRSLCSMHVTASEALEKATEGCIGCMATANGETPLGMLTVDGSFNVGVALNGHLSRYEDRKALRALLAKVAAHFMAACTATLGFVQGSGEDDAFMASVQQALETLGPPDVSDIEVDPRAKKTPTDVRSGPASPDDVH